MLNELDWLNVGQIITVHTFKLIHSIRFGRCPEYLNGRLQCNSEIHNYNTRRRDNYR